MSETTHHGSCHCGAVQFTATLDASKPGMICNCSMCGRAGAILQFIPADKFALDKGESNLTDYQFNKNIIHHVFCKTCGIKPFARGKTAKGEDTVAINLRCLDTVDTFAAVAAAKQYDGKRA